MAQISLTSRTDYFYLHDSISVVLDATAGSKGNLGEDSPGAAEVAITRDATGDDSTAGRPHNGRRRTGCMPVLRFFLNKKFCLNVICNFFVH